MRVRGQAIAPRRHPRPARVRPEQGLEGGRACSDQGTARQRGSDWVGGPVQRQCGAEGGEQRVRYG